MQRQATIIQQAASDTGVVPSQESKQQHEEVQTNKEGTQPNPPTNTTITAVSQKEWSELMLTLKLLEHKLPASSNGGVKTKCTFVHSSQQTSSTVHGILITINDKVLLISLDRVLEEWQMTQVPQYYKKSNKKGKGLSPMSVYSNFDLELCVNKLIGSSEGDDSASTSETDMDQSEVVPGKASQAQALQTHTASRVDQPPAQPAQSLEAQRRKRQAGEGKLQSAPNHWEQVMHREEKVGGGTMPSAVKQIPRAGPYTR